ncbi:MAG TPA: DUF5009 domain-containing protein [Syntrophobacteraceae bacterium]|nr:DUF5009 domain-containing protein [Syntrophobacteraceae bacterium]
MVSYPKALIDCYSRLIARAEKTFVPGKPRARSTKGDAVESLPSQRLLSLDVFRGAAIVGMILVNNPGRWRVVYSQLQHAPWNGWTFTDMIFPFFLFSVGISITFSFTRRIEQGHARSTLVFQAMKRTVLLFLLGIFLSNAPHFHMDNLRIPGVLQRIALCYFISSVLFLGSGWKGQASWMAALLLAYWLMTALIPVPGIGAGVYEPGRNFAAYVDSIFLENHMWSAYRSWDPEGIVSTLPAVSSTLFGVLAGHCLRTAHSIPRKTLGMLAAGVLFLLLGLALDPLLPINKSLWTSTYCVFMTGWALLCFGVFYWLIDGKGYRKWAFPFVVFGTNAIFAYGLSKLLDDLLKLVTIAPQGGGPRIRLKHCIFDFLNALAGTSKLASLLYAVLNVLAVFLVVYGLYRKRWFLKL